MKFEKDETLFTGRLKSMKFALKGAIKLITTEHSVMVQSSLAVLMTFAGFYFGINRYEWMMQILVFGLVLGIEGLNTAVEKICDVIQPEFDERIKIIKDIAAGAVVLMAFAAICTGILVYWKYIF